MSLLRIIAPHETPRRPAAPTPPPLHQPVPRWLWLLALCSAASCAVMLVWWFSNATAREIQALPADQRIPLYQRTMANLANVCDPAAPRSLRDFCHKQAELALQFRECDADPRCQELARRHLPRPFR